MATLNSARFLREALDSIAPAFGGLERIELVVADGGSSDGTLAILEGFAPARIVSRQDAGIYDAMNRAIAAARGEFVMLVNSDDALPAAAPGRALSALIGEPSAGWISGRARIGADVEAGIERRHGRPLSLEGALFGVPAINARIFRKSVLDRVGPIRTDIGLASDRELMARLALSGERGVHHEEAVYLYRQHAGSQTIGGDAQSRKRVYLAEARLARFCLSQDGASGELLRLSRAASALAAVKLAVGGDAGAAREAMRGCGGLDIARAARLAVKWRGVLSGY
jgi:glycosyltransferase involved in cell wall biosynthesis